MCEGQFISSFPLILRGLIRISRTSEEGNELLLYYMKENEFCAMALTCCMANMKSSIMAIAEEPTEVLMLPVVLIETWMCEFPSWKQFVMQFYRKSNFHDILLIFPAFCDFYNRHALCDSFILFK